MHDRFSTQLHPRKIRRCETRVPPVRFLNRYRERIIKSIDVSIDESTLFAGQSIIIKEIIFSLGFAAFAR